MISQRQIDFRQEYRSRIIGWYDGYLHIVIIYAMGAAAYYVYVAHIHNVTWLEWLTVPLTFLFTNLFEWAVHKYVMHRPVNIKGLRAVYERHTLNHHQFFTDDDHPRRRILAQRRLAVHVGDHRHVPGLRVHALLLPRR